jgi:hypothetical protein
MPRYREFARAGAVRRSSTAADGNPTMFKILELKGTQSAAAAQVGQHRYSTHEEALAAVRKHLKTFNVSGHNPEGNYWWARDPEGLRKCWISNAD